MKTISIILPVFNEEGNLPELITRLKAMFKTCPQYSWEMVFINDASRDNTLGMLISFANNDQTIKVLDFSRNFGHQIAITAGLDYCIGDAAIIMDSDLQDPPEILPTIIKQWEQGNDIVLAKRRARKDGFVKKITASIFYRIMKKLSSVEIPLETGDFRLLDRKAINEMKKLKEHSRFMRGLSCWIGFKQTTVEFDRDERKYGQTSYPFKKMLKLAVDGIVSFSYIPLKMATYLGILAAFFGFAVAIYALFLRIFEPNYIVPGWATLVIAVFVMGGIQLLVLGVIGEYIGRIYTEAQNRPLYVLKNKINV